MPIMQPHDARPGNPLRGILSLPLSLIWAFSYFLVIFVCILIAPEKMLRHKTRIINTFAAPILWLAGIRLSSHDSERVPDDEAGILMFNHINLLDIPVIAARWRDNWTAVIKQEFKNIPLMGRLMLFLEMIPIDRGNREKALASMREVKKLVQSERKMVLIAPEGTRSGNGRLGPFKRGPFHLAVQTGVPVYPVVMRGNEQLMKGLLICSGEIRLDVQQPVDTSGWKEETLDQAVTEVRDIYLQWLPDGQA